MATWKPDTQYNTNQNNPLPEWNPEWGGYGPNPFANYDRMAGVPEGGVDVTAMSPYSDPADIAAAQAKNAALAQQQAQPTVTKVPSGGSKTTATKKAVAKTTATSGGKSTTSVKAPSNSDAEYRKILLQLAKAGGRPNMDAIQLRTEKARELMDKTRGSQTDSLLANLSDLGLFGDGATYGGLGRLEENLAGDYLGSLNEIYADEYQQSDQRMMEALSILAGLDTADLDREVDWFGAKSADKLGGQGLDLERLKSDRSYSLGLGNLQLGNTDALLRAMGLVSGEDY